MDGSLGYEYRGRLTDGAPEETVISSEEAASMSAAGQVLQKATPAQPADPEKLLRFFGEPFRIIHSTNDRQQLLNLWEREAQIVSSIDYAKQDEVRERG